LEVSRNHFENLTKIHEKGNFVWTIEHTNDSIANMPVFSYPRGAIEKELPTTLVKDSTPEVDADNYYNSIYVQGRELSDGTRPSAEKKDQGEINDKGKEISPGSLRDLDVSSDIAAEFRAQSILNRALKNGELRGQKVVPATFEIQPGYAYGVTWRDKPKTYQTVEEILIRKTKDSAEATIDFVNRSGFARDIQELRRNARQTGDQL
jgi:hypothetical protein